MCVQSDIHIAGYCLSGLRTKYIKQIENWGTSNRDYFTGFIMSSRGDADGQSQEYKSNI
jgi:hypothetical protein